MRRRLQLNLILLIRLARGQNVSPESVSYRSTCSMIRLRCLVHLKLLMILIRRADELIELNVIGLLYKL